MGITVDGKFGANTRRALRNVQRMAGVAADAVYGSDTRIAMSGHGYWPSYDGGIQGGSYCSAC